MAFNGELYEIFSQLPAKPLHKFTTVAKQCLDYISEPNFMEKQCKNAMSNNDVGFFMEEETCLRSRATTLQLVPLPGNECSVGIPEKSLQFLREKGRILGSSNGLLLCQTIDSFESSELLLFNPATRLWMPITLPTKEMARRAQFGMTLNVVLLINNSSEKNTKNKFPLDYNVVLFDPDFESEEWPKSTNVHVLDQETGKWVTRDEKINMGGRGLRYDSSVLCKENTLYMLSDCADCIARNSPCYYPYVLSYDVHVGKSRMIDLPQEARENFTKSFMGIFGWHLGDNHGNTCFDSICLVKSEGYLFWVWVLEEHNKSWRLVVHLDKERDLGIKDRVWKPMSFAIVGSHLLFATDTSVYGYSLKGSDQGKLVAICDNECGASAKVRFISYSSTLRPCGNDSMELPT